MTLLAARKEFVNQSGRLDLMNVDNSDNGADFYINAAQRWLDRETEIFQEMAKVYRKISAGTQIVKIQDARVIHRVGVGESDSFNWLKKYFSHDLREKYAKPYEDVDQGIPEYYTPVILRGSHTGAASWDGIAAYMNTDSDWKTYNGILLMPIPDQEYHIEIWGKFYSEQLVDDDDTSFWTEMHEYILVMAAQRMLEVFYRNTQGVADWTQAIRAELFGMAKDSTEQSIADIDQIEG